ncbi:MAG: DNA polymerase III subunit delta [Lachnospiraceae bacterium]
MSTIKQQLQSGEYSQVYLLYGVETYLRNQAVDELKKALVSEDDSMNLSVFVEQQAQEEEVIRLSQTLPFFSEKRLILLQNTDLCKKASDEFLQNLSELPDSTVIVFVEDTIDKRTKLYKWIQKQGHIEEFDYLEEKSLIAWIQNQLEQYDKTIERSGAEELMERCGAEMTAILKELEKLISYVGERTAIMIEDVKMLVPIRVSNQIFKMISAISEGKRNTALQYYYDLLYLKESPLRILYLIAREYTILFRTKNFVQKNVGKAEMSKALGVPPFAVAKYMATSKRYRFAELKQKMDFCATMERKCKSGEMDPQIAVEIVIQSE